MFLSANQNKQLPNQGANLESHDASLVFMTVNTRIKSLSQAYAMKKIQIWKEVKNPFITRWDEPFAGKEKHVVNICLHGLNSDRAGRSPELLSVLSRRNCFTLASIARKDIMVQFGKESELCEDKNLIIYINNIFFTGRDELFAERGV